MKALKIHLKAKTPVLAIQTFEENRFLADIERDCVEAGYSLFRWTMDIGLTQWEKVDDNFRMKIVAAAVDPAGAIRSFVGEKPTTPNKSAILIPDLHLFDLRNYELVRAIKDFAVVAKNTERVLIILGAEFTLPKELEKEIWQIEYALPDREELRTVLERHYCSTGEQMNGHAEETVDASKGLTENEAEQAYAISWAEVRETCPAIVRREKCSTIKKGGLIEVIEPTVGMDDIGGLDYLKADLNEKRFIFTKEWREYSGGDTKCAMFFCGAAGTGKTLTATACGANFGLPLLRIYTGRLKGSLYGETDANWRKVYSTMKAVAPCVAHIDEAEGLFAGMASSGQTDGGATGLIKQILQDMQDSKDILWVFTANDIEGVPDPLIDRCEVWAVDLPSQAEREAIWKIHIAKRKFNPDDFSLATLAKLSEGFSGRQIEMAWVKALVLAFNDSRRKPRNDDVTEALGRMTATSVTMSEAIEARRKRLQNRARPASIADNQTVTKSQSRKLA